MIKGRLIKSSEINCMVESGIFIGENIKNISNEVKIRT
jgi:hypothetical protein